MDWIWKTRKHSAHVQQMDPRTGQTNFHVHSARKYKVEYAEKKNKEESNKIWKEYMNQ